MTFHTPMFWVKASNGIKWKVSKIGSRLDYSLILIKICSWIHKKGLYWVNSCPLTYWHHMQPQHMGLFLLYDSYWTICRVQLSFTPYSCEEAVIPLKSDKASTGEPRMPGMVDWPLWYNINGIETNKHFPQGNQFYTNVVSKAM